MKIDVDSLTQGGDPYEKFCDSIRDAETKRKYKSYLRQFLAEIPENVYQMALTSSDEGTPTSDEQRAKSFTILAKKDQDMAQNIIAQYIKLHKKRVEKGELNPNTLPNLIKPIHALLDSNGVSIHWKSLYKMYPRPLKTQDRAYTRSEIQKMMQLSHDITDKVVLSMFSSGGFRVEAWEYFCWKDITFFKNSDGTFKGAAVMVYRGDPECYFTFVTPEACKYLNMYKEKWKSEIGVHPRDNDPLLRVTTQITIKQLNSKGVKSRITNLAKEAGLRPELKSGRKRHEVPIDHGFRKYFNTMMRRAKVNYLDKEDMMGHTTGLEKHYERYNEADFERFSEYQKAIPFLTISDDERLRVENKQQQTDMQEIQQKNTQLENLSQRIDDLENGAKARWNNFYKETHNMDKTPGTKLSYTLFQMWFEMRATEKEKREMWKKMQKAKKDGKILPISELGESDGLHWDNLVSELPYEE